MTRRDKVRLYLSILISLAWWNLIYTVPLGFIFTFAILFHEYGHYYWMGREGIRNKAMTMMPPFGALAITREPWPSLGAEARIALAGPGFGLVSAIFLVILWSISGSYIIRIGIFLVCLINLSNLCLPVAILDGGRIIKSILLSINKSVAIGFYYLSFAVLSLYVLRFPSIFTLVMAYILFRILSSDYNRMRSLINTDEQLPAMTRKEIFLSIGLYTLITSSLFVILFKNNIWLKDLMAFLTN